MSTVGADIAAPAGPALNARVLLREGRGSSAMVGFPKDTPRGHIERRDAAAKRAARVRRVRGGALFGRRHHHVQAVPVERGVRRRCAPADASPPGFSTAACPSAHRARTPRRCRRRRVPRSAPSRYRDAQHCPIGLVFLPCTLRRDALTVARRGAGAMLRGGANSPIKSPCAPAAASKVQYVHPVLASSE
jgi:anti-sigma factor RsiW